jgi:hypothetical protein
MTPDSRMFCYYHKPAFRNILDMDDTNFEVTWLEYVIWLVFFIVEYEEKGIERKETERAVREE